ncbi:PREDICTED: uncharacterized protein LOC108568017 [Nicrophorus vespilloides]|uniref:Uncharacterized protein LOC108568017 n=1 Tax=Nicrophorus vespilloides TaxID=110193 RepID=A0ABM1NBZ9_NICVS|nr:PREDICTED: uncharacterized protein LOC108568017 [Nicrophorus vespilloides]XP_017784349.1 PREDICTED: uncharacterized protein LOC108568017 [Nicrophorus vespilloides]XP_017784350.1 PREDICTED: uncharacterized protein LOC108568017 [Nicrophorus vespilloides]
MNDQSMFVFELGELRKNVNDLCECPLKLDDSQTKDMVRECVNIIKHVEMQKCKDLKWTAKMFKNIASHLEQFKNFSCSNPIVSENIKHRMDSCIGMDYLLPSLKIDVDSLENFLRSTSKEVLHLHAGIRHETVSWKKRECLEDLNKLYKIVHTKYCKVNCGLHEVLKYVKELLLEQAKAISQLDMVMDYMDNVKSYIVLDGSYLKDFRESVENPNPRIEMILLRSLEMTNCDDRREFCFEELHEVWMEYADLEESLNDLKEVICNLQESHDLLQTVGESIANFSLLCSYDLQLHSIESQISMNSMTL